MSELIINNEPVKGWEIIETAEEMNIKRFVYFKQYYIHRETGVPLPSIVEAMKKFYLSFDKDSKSGMLIAIYDYLKGIEQVSEHEDPDQILFALICNKEGEDTKDWSKKIANKKLEELSALGLTQGQVKEEVENFILGCPLLLSSSSQKSLEMPSSQSDK